MSVNTQDAAYLWRMRLVLFGASVAQGSGELPSRPRELLGPHGGRARGQRPVRRGGGVLAS